MKPLSSSIRQGLAACQGRRGSDPARTQLIPIIVAGFKACSTIISVKCGYSAAGSSRRMFSAILATSSEVWNGKLLCCSANRRCNRP